MAGPVTQEVRDYIGAYIRLTYGSQRAAAKAWGVGQSFLSLVVNGHSSPPDWMLAELGIGKISQTPLLGQEGVQPNKRCNCLSGQCQRAARECANWIKRAAK